MKTPSASDRHAILVGEVPDRECLDPFGALDASLSAQLPAEGGPAPVTAR